MRMSAAVAAALLASAVVGATPSVAGAAFPGANGRIAFEQGDDIYSIRADGSDVRRLTTDARSHSPRWSPDGRSIAFSRGGDIWVMRGSGLNARRVTSGTPSDVNPAWSPDGTRLVFSRTTSGTATGRSLYVKPLAGGTPQLLTTASDGCAVEPTWSADGRYVVYEDLCAAATSGGPRLAIRKVDTSTGAVSDVVGAAGSARPDGQVHAAGSGPDVTPNGQRVVFTARTASTDLCGVAITDLTGGAFRFITTPIDCCVFLSDHPAVSPDGSLVVYTAGNENPQLAVAARSGSNQCCNSIYSSGTSYFPIRADWQPRP